ncbi:hypothetical protein E2C01_042638 [Portunus trituberculatus]|uniref:Uncharacterized protein n=1 Tax=Portunus trituberculatus TaxID=210409 RepID=A0A5B7FV71_PORTR|nr:hypothetical protein [Portunus trituberculatus]
MWSVWRRGILEHLQHHGQGHVVDEKCSSGLAAGEQATIMRLIRCWLCWSEGSIETNLVTWGPSAAHLAAVSAASLLVSS